MTVDFAATKSQYDLATYVESQGNVLRQSGSVMKCLCPFHDEKTPSFVIDEGHWRCYGACNCGGDIFDFVTMSLHGSVDRSRESALEAYNVIVGGQPTPAFHKREAIPTVDKPMPTMEQIVSFYRGFNLALPYFEGRSVSESVARQKMLGATMDYSNAYTFEDGTKQYFTCKRYIIPHLRGGEVRNWNARRDDIDATERLDMVDSKLIDRIMDDMIKQSKGKLTTRDIGQAEVTKALFGDKYKQAWGGKTTVFNGDVLVSDGKLAQVSYVLISEGEICTLSLETLGFRAVASKVNHVVDLKQAFSQVTMPMIIAQNDGPGVAYAQQMRDHLGRGRIITPPSGFKDANDVAVAGQALNWLAGYGIEPK